MIGELACGNLADRARVLGDLLLLPAACTATDDEVRQFIDRRRLWGKGIGWIDAHLIASALLTNCDLWTLDTALARAASSAGVAMYTARR